MAHRFHVRIEEIDYKNVLLSRSTGEVASLATQNQGRAKVQRRIVTEIKTLYSGPAALQPTKLDRKAQVIHGLSKETLNKKS